MFSASVIKEVNLLMASLERGESEVLTLAKEIKADLILLDAAFITKDQIIVI
jgi:predicted nucleic acid-binding protein